MAFVRRQIVVQFTLGANLATGQPQPPFEEGGNTAIVGSQPATATNPGTRISVKMTQTGANAMASAEVAIFGMTLSLMNKLSTLGLNPRIIGPNYMTILAGNAGEVLPIVFQGNISNAWADLNGSPDFAFRVEGQAGLSAAVAPNPASSYPGPTNAADVMQNLAGQMNYGFENSGVSVVLDKPYYWGSARNQAYACAADGNFNCWIDPVKNVLAIWPKGQARNGEAVLISPETGMIGYPTYVSKGIQVRSEFNASIVYGGKINVQSILTPACGEKVVFGLDHDLEAEMPGGAWFSTIRAAPLGSVVTSPGAAPVPD